MFPAGGFCFQKVQLMRVRLGLLSDVNVHYHRARFHRDNKISFQELFFDNLKIIVAIIEKNPNQEGSKTIINGNS